MADGKTSYEDIDDAVGIVMSDVFETVKGEVIARLGGEAERDFVWEISSKLTIAVELELLRRTNKAFGQSIATRVGNMNG